MTELARETAYIIVRGDYIIGDSRTFTTRDASGMPPAALCKAADLRRGKDISMITYQPVDTFAKRDEVYEVYLTEGLPVQHQGYYPVEAATVRANALVRANGKLMGYVRILQPCLD